MKELEKLIWKQLDEYKKRDKLSMSDLEIVHKLTDTIKNIMKIDALGGYDEDMSGRHYVRGHYSRNDYRYGENDYRNNDYREDRYSRANVVDKLEKIMHDAPENEKAIIRRAIDEIR